MFLWYALGVILCLALVCEFYTLKTGVPTITSFPSARRKIIEILKSEVDLKPSDKPYTIIDLGSGNGRLTSQVARALPSAQVIGIEISFVPWVYSVLRQRVFGPKNLEYKRADFWPYDISNADAIIIYVTENIFERLEQKLKKELKPGTIVVANDVILRGDWSPSEIHDTGFLQLKVFVYRQTGPTTQLINL
ncbi:MAG: methyltransferase domain-containing protein [Bdellovibrionales bacterium]